MAKAKDGWHRVYDYEVYTDDGKVLRALSSDGQKTAYPYRWSEKLQCRTKCTGISINALRAGLKNETIEIR